MDLAEEKELVRQAQRKNPDAFAKLYEQYFRKIYSYVVRQTTNVEISEDITSQTFANALEKLWQFQWRNISFSSWLYKIATNEIKHYFEKAEYRKSISLEKLWEQGFDFPSCDDIEKELIATQEELKTHQNYLEARRRIMQLPGDYPWVITLRFVEQKSIKETADILGKKEGTIKSLEHRGLEMLRKEDWVGL